MERDKVEEIRGKIMNILKTRTKQLIGEDLISPLFWEDYASDVINAFHAEQSRITEQGELFKKELEILRKLNERRSGAMHAYDIADWPVVDLCLAEIFTLEEQLANLHPITEQSSVVVTDDDIFIQYPIGAYENEPFHIRQLGRREGAKWMRDKLNIKDK